MKLQISIALAILAVATPAAAEEGRLDVEAAQAIMSIQELDGWLLYSSQKSANPVAEDLVKPTTRPTRRWFYFVPSEGQPIMLVHKTEAGAFTEIAGTKIEYTGNRDLKTGLREVLAGAKLVAMEYSPKSGIPSLTRVDAATVAMVQSLGVKVMSSADLVQFTKSLWGLDGRVAHYVATHHLSKLRSEALDYVAEQIRSRKPVTEMDVQKFLMDGYKIRGLVGDPPLVAVNDHTADPRYQPSDTNTTVISTGDLLLLDMNAQVVGADRPIFASLSWVAFVGAEVPERYSSMFKVVARARDETIDYIENQVSKGLPVNGADADRKARSVVGEAGFADRFVHRTGHSLDTSFEGDGANLDSFETTDDRNLVQDSGFTVGPGVYVAGDFGVRSEVSVYIGRKTVEVTTPLQDTITPILGR